MKKTSIEGAAKLIVSLPADAKLFVDDKPMKTASATRVFRTPELEAGQVYYYILRAQVVRAGKTVEQSQRVLVHAGEVVKTSFSELEQQPTAVAVNAR